MECELERGQRICPYRNVRHIGRCQDVNDLKEFLFLVADENVC